MKDLTQKLLDLDASRKEFAVTKSRLIGKDVTVNTFINLSADWYAYVDDFERPPGWDISTNPNDKADYCNSFYVLGYTTVYLGVKEFDGVPF